MPATAKDIAQKLGLSQPTVSRILSGDTRHRIAEATRQRVLDTAREMDYRPNAVARSLRRRRTGIVGFYSGHAPLDTRHDFIGALVGSLQAACVPRGLDLLLHSVPPHRPTDDIYNDLVDGRVDGLFFHGALENPLIARLAASHLPVVALVDAMEGMPSVVADGAGGVRLLLDRLTERGHRTIAYVRPEVRLAAVEERVAAYEDAMRTMRREPMLLSVANEEAETLLDDLLARAPRPTAVCCWNDRTAYRLLWRCLQAGVRVPEDLAIAGFDGFTEMKLPVRRLTTVCVPYDAIAARALEILTDGMEGRAVPPRTTLPVALSPGDTT